MAVQRPLVIISGEFSELPPGDTASDISVGSLIAGSGVYGGGDLSTPVDVGVELAPNPSGLIIVGTGPSSKLSDDGAATVFASTALASGQFALETNQAALASGDAAILLGEEAIASGLAAIEAVDDLPRGTLISYTAGTTVVSGNPVGLNQQKEVEPVREITDRYKLLNSAAGLAIPYTPVASGITTVQVGLNYMPDINRVVCFYQDAQSGADTWLRVGTVGPTNVTDMGSQTLVQAAYPTYLHNCTHEAENRTVISYRWHLSPYYLYMNSCTVNPVDNSITRGTNYIAYSETVTYPQARYDRFNNVIRWGAFNATTGEEAFIEGYVTLSDTTFSDGDRHTITSVGSASYVDFDINNSGVALWGFVIPSKTTGSNKLFCRTTTISSGLLTYTSPTEQITPNDTFPISDVYAAVRYGEVCDRFAIAGKFSNTNGSCSVRVVNVSGSTPIVANSSGMWDQDLLSFIPRGYGFTYNNTTDTFQIAYDGGSAVSGGVGTFTIDPYENVISNVGFHCINSGWTPSGEDIDAVTPSMVYCSGADRTVHFAYHQTAHTYTFNSGLLTTLQQTEKAYAPTTDAGYPFVEPGRANFIGIAQNSASGGESVSVRLPGSVDNQVTGLSAGSVYYLDPLNSGVTTDSTKPTNWSGSWNQVARATKSDSLLLTDNLL
jgi:hypothetical protein